MSSFTALNLSAAEVAFDAEEHTRELQIEEAFKVFQRALKAQQAGHFEESDKAYDELFEIEVITSEININAASPTVKTLRYLAYRNRGLLHFDELRSKIQDISSEDSYDLLLDSLDDLSESLQYNEGDDIVIDLLLSLFEFFGSDRLSRYLIEYQITKEETDELYLHNRTKLASPNFISYLQAESLLLKKLSVPRDTPEYFESPSIGKKLEDLTFLIPLRSYMNERKELMGQRHIKTISLDQITWKNIAVKLQNVVPRSKQKSLKFKDGYRFDNNTIQIINFKSVAEDVMDLDDLKVLDTDIDVLNDGHVGSKNNASEDENEVETLTVHFDDSKEALEPKTNENLTNLNQETAASPNDGDNTAKDSEDNQETFSNSKAEIQVVEIDEEKDRQPDEESENPPKDISGTEINPQKDLSGTEISSTKRPASDPQPQRLSKRVRHLAEPETHTNKVDEFDAFLLTFKKYLSTEVAPEGEITAKSIITSGSSNLCYSDFKSCLQSWTLRFTELLSSQNEKSQSGLALSELINTNISNSSLSSDAEVQELDNERALNFITQVNNNSLHFIETKILLLKIILGESKGGFPIINNYIDKDLYKAIESLVLNSEADYFAEFSEQASAGYLSVGVATFEILVNHWINLKQKVKSKGMTQKSNSDLQFQVAQIEEPIERWRCVLTALISTEGNDVLLMRFRWCCLLYLQHGQAVSLSYLKVLLGDLYDDYHGALNETTIEFPNYDAIPTLNSKMIKNQSDKLNVLNTFENTLGEGENTNEEANKLLENVLLGLKTNELSDEERSMDQFVSGSSITLKLKLWKILLDSYISSSDLRKYEQAMGVVLPLLLSQIEGDSYQNQNETQRYQTLLSTLGFYSDYTEGFASILEANDWKLIEPNNIISSSVLKFLRIFFFYIIEEFYDKLPSAKPFSETAPKSSNKLHDIITNSFIVLFIFERYQETSNPDDKYDLFSVIHSQLGHLGFCDAASGRFLRLSEALWKDADVEIYESDILQHLDCRFHISISNERFTPYEHDTQKLSLTKSSAISFTPCLMNLVHRKKDNMNSILKPDLKYGIDAFSEAIGEPDLSLPIVQKNDFILSQFLDSELNTLFYRKALSGALDIDLKKGFSDEQSVADQGLFYSQAVNNLNVYKMRKKAMQSTVSELEDVHKMIRSDLLYGSRRPESWFILGQAFSLQVEDDLVWTSDKLNVYEKKLGTASLQKKSIISYLMSLSLCAQCQLDGLDVKKEFLISLLSLLGQATFNSLSTPMSGLCFKSQFDKKILTLAGISSFPANTSDGNQPHLFNSNLQIMRLAVKNDRDNWQNHYYNAKILHKMKSPVKFVMQSCVNSCLSNKTAIEPHYLLLTMLHKYFKQGKVSADDSLIYLEKADTFFGFSKEIISDAKDSFENIIIAGLKKINQIDKKKWHHKHRYRLSKIYYDNEKFESAYHEIESLILLKSTNKNLVSIWKPEFEAPGKHFVYTYTYILYYIKLINHFADFHKLLLFTKKLRRYGSGMINLVEAWDYSCLTLCLLTKEIIGAEAGFTDIEVPKLIYVEFMQGSQSLTEKFKQESLNDEQKKLFTLLYEISEIRRMNNGFGSTSQLDDTFNAIYLKFYLQYVTPETKHIFINDQTLSKIKFGSTPIKIKVARRDILAAATALVKVVEPKLSENKISDERGFDVPELVKQRHLEKVGTKASDSLKTTAQAEVKSEVLIKNVSDQKVDIELQTPEPKDNDGTLKSNAESEDEFHTPANSSFDVGDTEIVNKLQDGERGV